MNGFVRDFEQQGIVVQGEARSGPIGRVAMEIVEEAEAFEADGIVLGSRGLSDWAAILVGSVAHRVISHAHCPVIVAR